MADNKTTRSRPRRKVLRFPQAKGKIIARIELSVSPEHSVVDIGFQDRTALSFTIQPCIRVTPELADWKTGNYRSLKRWRHGMMNV